MKNLKFKKGSYERIHRNHENLELLDNEYALVYDLKNSYITNLYIGKSIEIDEDITILKNIFVCSLETEKSKNISCDKLKKYIDIYQEDIKKEMSDVIY